MALSSTTDAEAIKQLSSILKLAHCRKPVGTSDRLIAEFETMGAMLAASPERLLRVVDGDRNVVHAITTFRAAMLYSLRATLAAKPVFSSLQALTDYLHADMAHRSTERVRVLFLNTRNMLIRDEVMGEGSIDEATFYVREVIRRAIDLGSSAIILVHNHPSGDATPSRADIDITRRVAEGGRRLGISLHDHIIITTGGHSSMRAMGLL